MGEAVGHEPHDACGSSDALARYEDGSAYCWSCKTYVPADGSGVAVSRVDSAEDWTPIRGEYWPFMKRGLTEETCRKSGYQYHRESKRHVMNIRAPGGALVAQKTRDAEKNFSVIGPARKDLPIYLSWLWPAKGKAVILTEGEIDALSYWQAWDHKYPVGSLPSGASSVKKSLMKHYEHLLGFDYIYLCFDADEPGRQALQEACDVLPVGKVKIITLPEDCKDANDVLLKHGPQALVSAFYNAKEYRPDGIRSGREFTKERLKRKRRKGFELPWPKLDGMWMGLRDAEVTTLCAGSGIGKSTIARHMAYHLRTHHDLKIGNIYLEEDNDTSVAAYVGLHQGVPLKRLLADPESLPDALWDASLEAVVWDQMMFYDHFGSLESDRLLTMMRYMAASGCRFIVLDHISIVVSGLATNDERRDIDMLMTKLASFVKETNVGVIAIVHLKRSQGKDFNKGGQISLNDLRGSASIEQLSFNVLALERDQQDESKKLFAQMRSLKCRVTGETGEADRLKWNIEKGCYEVASPFDDGEPPFDPHQAHQQEETDDVPF
jgi:twinkle protein